MTTDLTALDRALSALNPYPFDDSSNPSGVLDLRARHDLDRILSDPGTAADTAGSAGSPSRLVVRRRTLLATTVPAAVVLVVAGIGLLGSNGPATPAYAETPPLLKVTPAPGTADPAGELESLADRVQALPDMPNGHGDVAEVHTKQWALYSRIGDKQVTSDVVVENRTTWRRPDGSGLVRSSYTAASVGVPPPTSDTLEPAPAAVRSRELSSDPVVLATQLAKGHPASNGPAERIVAIRDAVLDAPLGPTVRAALLRYLAATPGLTFDGSVVDRAGRHGLAFSVESDYSGLPTRYTVIVDPHTGALLGEEEELTSRAGKLNVKVPCVIAYTTFLGAKYLDDVP
jgi:hypothetical protein